MFDCGLMGLGANLYILALEEILKQNSSIPGGS